MLTPLELDIMKAVWSRPPVTVRDVQIAIHPARKLAYTTVMTVMNRLFLKGFLTRTLRSRTHLYEPTIPYAQVRDAALSGLIDNFFGGSRQNLREFLTEEAIEPPQHSTLSHPASLDETLL
jgi:predicted transcriptional regulator